MVLLRYDVVCLRDMNETERSDGGMFDAGDDAFTDEGSGYQAWAVGFLIICSRFMVEGLSVCAGQLLGDDGGGG
jgi:hypothetical protein